MISANFSPSKLRLLVRLVNSRQRLAREMADLDDRILSTLNQTEPDFGKASPRKPLSESRVNSMGHPSVPSLSPKSGSKYGDLKSVVLATLAAAGEKGLTIREIAHQVGVLNARINGWFSATGKEIAGVEKVSRGRWRYVPDPE